MEEVMIDLETLGLTPGSTILSIGAVPFDRTGISKKYFHSAINHRSCLDVGLEDDPKTVAWWEEQENEAKVLLDLVRDSKTPRLKSVLLDFSEFLKKISPDVKVWGNGSAEDIVWLKSAYQACGFEVPWSYRNVRCYRTLKNLFPNILVGEEAGFKHHALYDARNQAEHAARMLEQFHRKQKLMAII